MKVLYVLADQGACAFVRAALPASYLKRANLAEVRTVGVTKATVKDGKDNLDWADVIVYCRQIIPTVFEGLEYAKGKGKVTVFDLDDNLSRLHWSSPFYKIWRTPQVKESLGKFLRAVDCITVSTENLREFYSQFNRCTMLPNCVDPEAFAMFNHIPPQNGELRIGWMGSSTHLFDVKEMMAAVVDFIVKHPEATFVTYGWDGRFQHGMKKEIKNCFEDIPMGRIEICDPSPFTKFYQELGKLKMHIGLAPLASQRFNEAKSALKWFDYSMAGAATIASDFGPFKAIEHKVSGLLAHNYKTWTECLEKLADTEYRENMIKRARYTILSQFSMNKRVHEWSELYESLIEGR